MVKEVENAKMASMHDGIGMGIDTESTIFRRRLGKKKKETPGKGRANRTQILLEGGVWAGEMPDGSSPRGRNGSKQLTTTTSVHCFKGRKRAKWVTWGKPTFSCTYIFAHVSASTCRGRRRSYIAQAVSPHCAHDELNFFSRASCLFVYIAYFAYSAEAK